MNNVNSYQVGGTHYKTSNNYQHWDFVIDCELDYLSGCMTKYVARWRNVFENNPEKALEDLEKSKHYIEKAKAKIKKKIRGNSKSMNLFLSNLNTNDANFIQQVLECEWVAAQRLLSNLIGECKLKLGEPAGDYTNQGNAPIEKTGLTIREQIERMLEMQDHLNHQIFPDWRVRDFPWYRAIISEANELIDQIGWKWWKNEIPNEGQCILEIIDIWHFGMSEMMVSLEGEDLISTIEDAMSNLNPNPKFSKHKLEITELFISECLVSNSFPLYRFFELASSFGLTTGELYKLYIGKQVLNRFRQDHGYKEGTYIKLWGELEDNHYLMSILDNIDLSEYMEQHIYNSLGELYGEFNAAILQ